MSWVLLFGLTTLAAISALGLTLRARPEGRAEAGILFTLVFYGVICAPIFLLGYTNLLQPRLLAPLSLLTSAVAFLASAKGRSRREHARDTIRTARALARLPLDAFARVLAERSMVLVGLFGATLAIVLSAWLTYLAPSESWDGLFYHEPIVGYAIQNQGFRLVSLPQTTAVQGVNGYPRLCEGFALWFVIFTDRSLIEIGNTVAAPGLMLGVYLLGRRYTTDVISLIGWSATVLLMPAMLTQMRTSMIDVEVAFFLLAAVHYATRPQLRLEDAIAASLAMVLIVGSKSMALVWVPPLAVVTYGRLLFAQRHGQLRPAVAVAVAGGATIAGVGALTFARNYVAFKNPLWPVSYVNPSLHINWPGLVTLDEISPSLPLRELVARKYGLPTRGVGDLIERDYGYGVPWVLVPLSAISLVAALVTALLARLRRRPDRETESLLVLAVLGAIYIAVSPSLNVARYNAHIVTVAIVLVVWVAGRLRGAARIHRGVVIAALLLTIFPTLWTGWCFGTSAEKIPALVRASARDRATMNAQTFQMPPEVARAREQELRAGDLVVFGWQTEFPGVLWNHAMSNRVEFIEAGGADQFIEEANRRRAQWVVVGARSRTRAALERLPGEWALVGTATQQDRTVAFRRQTR